MTGRDWPWRFEAKVRRIVDADTLELMCDLGFGVNACVRIRVQNVDAPERHTPEGNAATLYAITLLGASPGVAVETTYQRTFDRYVGKITLPDGSDYGEHLIEAGHAVRRTG